MQEARRKKVSFTHASVADLKRMIEERFPEADIRRLDVRYLSGGRYPDAAIISTNGTELRLERDDLDGLWTIATNERIPRLLGRFNDAQLGEEAIKILHDCHERLRE